MIKEENILNSILISYMTAQQAKIETVCMRVKNMGERTLPSPRPPQNPFSDCFILLLALRPCPPSPTNLLGLSANAHFLRRRFGPRQAGKPPAQHTAYGPPRLVAAELLARGSRDACTCMQQGGGGEARYLAKMLVAYQADSSSSPSVYR